MTTRILVVGAGRMGAQIAVEFALAGHPVVVAVRHQDDAQARLDAATGLVRQHALRADAEVAAARHRLTVTGWPTLHDDVAPGLVVESVPEELDLKVDVLGVVAERYPEAILATNTSALSLELLGTRIGAPDRTLRTHYLNPPLLMPLVELIRPAAVDGRHVRTVVEWLRDAGKRPVVVTAALPGFTWNRLQVALLREAVHLVESGCVSAADLDLIVEEGLGRRWRAAGPLRTAALGGAQTFTRIARQILPTLSARTDLDGLADLLDRAGVTAGPEVVHRRDALLAADLAAQSPTDTS